MGQTRECRQLATYKQDCRSYAARRARDVAGTARLYCSCRSSCRLIGTNCRQRTERSASTRILLSTDSIQQGTSRDKQQGYRGWSLQLGCNIQGQARQPAFGRETACASCVILHRLRASCRCLLSPIPIIYAQWRDTNCRLLRRTT